MNPDEHENEVAFGHIFFGLGWAESTKVLLVPIPHQVNDVLTISSAIMHLGIAYYVARCSQHQLKRHIIIRDLAHEALRAWY